MVRFLKDADLARFRSASRRTFTHTRVLPNSAPATCLPLFPRSISRSTPSDRSNDKTWPTVRTPPRPRRFRLGTCETRCTSCSSASLGSSAGIADQTASSSTANPKIHHRARSSSVSSIAPSFRPPPRPSRAPRLQTHLRVPRARRRLRRRNLLDSRFARRQSRVRSRAARRRPSRASFPPFARLRARPRASSTSTPIAVLARAVVARRRRVVARRRASRVASRARRRTSSSVSSVAVSSSRASSSSLDIVVARACGFADARRRGVVVFFRGVALGFRSCAWANSMEGFDRHPRTPSKSNAPRVVLIFSARARKRAGRARASIVAAHADARSTTTRAGERASGAATRATSARRRRARSRRGRTPRARTIRLDWEIVWCCRAVGEDDDQGVHRGE